MPAARYEPSPWPPPGRPRKFELPEIVGSGPVLEHLIGSRIRARLLAALLVEPGRRPWFRRLAAEAGSGSGARRELAFLESIGFVRSEREASARFYRVNEAHPLCAPLRALILAAAQVDGSAPDRWKSGRFEWEPPW